MATETNPAIKSLISSYEKLSENTKVIEDIIDDANNKGDDLINRLESLQKESQDFEIIEQKLSQSKENQEIIKVIDTHKTTLRENKDIIMHNHDVLKDKEKEVFDLDSFIIEETTKNQIEKDRHTNSIDYKKELFKLWGENQDALISNLQDQLSKLTQHIELTQDNKKKLEIDIKEHKQKDSELRTNWEKSTKILQDRTKAPYDELKLKQVQRENKTLKFRIEQGTKDGDDYATQLISIKDRRDGIINDVKVMESYKIINEQLKEETEDLNGQLIKLLANERQLKDQNMRLTKQLNDKKRVLGEKEAIIDIRNLENEDEEMPRKIDKV